MESRALLRYVRISPRKLRLVADKIRGRELPDAVDILNSVPKKGSGILMKLMLSAAANGKVRFPDLNEEELYVKKLVVDEAPTMKRIRPRARGRASRIRKRNSHVTIVLSDE